VPTAFLELPAGMLAQRSASCFRKVNEAPPFNINEIFIKYRALNHFFASGWQIRIDAKNFFM
jgi:hypothetical protein